MDLSLERRKNTMDLRALGTFRMLGGLLLRSFLPSLSSVVGMHPGEWSHSELSEWSPKPDEYVWNPNYFEMLSFCVKVFSGWLWRLGFYLF